MIKLTNRQCDALLSPLAQKLFTNEDRKFPVDVAFKLLDIITCIRQRIKSYHTTFRDIVKRNGGTIDDLGVITYNSTQGRSKANEEIEDLMTMEIEIHGFKIPMDKSWPELTIAEAEILRPIIKDKKENK